MNAIVSDDVVIYACEPCGYVSVQADAPRKPPPCPKCGDRVKHVGPDTYKRMTSGRSA